MRTAKRPPLFVIFNSKFFLSLFLSLYWHFPETKDMRRTLFCILTALLATNAVAQTGKDTLYFLNGTRVIGEVKSIKLGVMTFDPDDANDITVQLRKLRSIAAVRQVFRIETIHEKVYFGRLLPHRLPNYALVETWMDTVELPIEEISVLYPFKNDFFQRFSGSASAGF